MSVVYNVDVLTTLIVTTKNEALSLPHLLDSIAAQTRMPDEIVIVDGGSTDTTLEILQAFTQRLPLRIMSRPGANISQGRNMAIQAAAGEIICSTDAGVRLDSCWLEKIAAPLEKGRADVVSGFFIPDPCSVFETALAATTLPTLQDIRPERFLPSSRSIAFRKEAWAQVKGYPEWLDYCEDLIFDFALHAANFRFEFVPQAIVHFRPRSHLRAFFKQYYLYARGDGKANLWFKRHIIRYVTYLLALPLLIVLTFVFPLPAFALWIVAALVMFYTPYKRLLSMWRLLSLADRLRALAWVPIVRVTGDLAKMLGYPVGVAWRMRRGAERV